MLDVEKFLEEKETERWALVSCEFIGEYHLTKLENDHYYQIISKPGKTRHGITHVRFAYWNGAVLHTMLEFMSHCVICDPYYDKELNGRANFVQVYKYKYRVPSRFSGSKDAIYEDTLYVLYPLFNSEGLAKDYSTIQWTLSSRFH